MRVLPLGRIERSEWGQSFVTPPEHERPSRPQNFQRCRYASPCERNHCKARLFAVDATRREASWLRSKH
jgi:hypothetical protein